MAASNFSGGRKNYYKVAYGSLSTKVKEVSDDYTEITEAELKSTMTSVDNIDLRNRFITKTGQFPLQVFYDTIRGTIQGIEKNEYDKGISLNVTIEDTDGDTSVVQMNFYSKYSENLLNRLLSLDDISGEITFTPYAIPSEAEDAKGKKIKFYSQGVAIKKNGEKIAIKFKADDKQLPKTERIKDASGKLVTSRVSRVDFLYDSVISKFGDFEDAPEPVEVEENDDLPF